MSDLRQRVSHAMWHQGVDAAIDLVLEEAEKAIKETKTKSRAIAAIRALKEKQ